MKLIGKLDTQLLRQIRHELLNDPNGLDHALQVLTERNQGVEVKEGQWWRHPMFYNVITPNHVIGAYLQGGGQELYSSLKVVFNKYSRELGIGLK